MLLTVNLILIGEVVNGHIVERRLMHKRHLMHWTIFWVPMNHSNVCVVWLAWNEVCVIFFHCNVPIRDLKSFTYQPIQRRTDVEFMKTLNNGEEFGLVIVIFRVDDFFSLRFQP
jgi:hypothetical protein